MPVIVICANPACRTPFAKKASQVARAARHYCQQSCRRSARPPEETLRKLYLEERQSTPAIAKLFGVSWYTVLRWFTEFAIPVRSASEAKRLDMERWSHEDRLRITAASRAIIDLPGKPHDWLVKRAKGVEKNPTISKFERLLLAALAEHAVIPIPQYAVDKYNIDLALPEHMLAIEVHGGNWHNTSLKKRNQDAEKFEVLRQHGWQILIVNTRRKPWLKLGVTAILDWLSNHPDFPQHSRGDSDESDGASRMFNVNEQLRLL